MAPLNQAASTSSLSSSEGERVPEGRVRGSSDGCPTTAPFMERLFGLSKLNDPIKAHRRCADCVGESGGGIIRDRAGKILPGWIVHFVLELEAAGVAGGGLPH